MWLLMSEVQKLPSEENIILQWLPLPAWKEVSYCFGVEKYLNIKAEFSFSSMTPGGVNKNDKIKI